MTYYIFLFFCTLEVARLDLAVTVFIDDIGTALVAKVTTLGVVMVLVWDTLMVGVGIIRLMPCCCCCWRICCS